MIACPCCGQPMADAADPRAVLATLKLSPMQLRVCNHLARHFGKWRTWDQIVEAIYADDPNGGPEDGRVVLDQFIFRARKRLVGSGLAIESYLGRGSVGRRMVLESSLANSVEK